mgnify:CR=1 FL=1
MKKLTTRQIALNGVVAGLYAAITILTASFAYGNIQFRIADSLCVLVVLEPSLTVGLTLGCLISNIFSTVSALDIVIGTAGTLLGCLLAARVKRDWLVPVPVILANAVLVGACWPTRSRRTRWYRDFSSTAARCCSARQSFYICSACRCCCFSGARG